MIRLSVPDIGIQEQRAVAAILKSGFFVQGKTVESFEKKIADFLNIPYAVAVSSGTSALHLSLLALDIGPQDEVIVPDYTFPATANVVELVGARPVIVDIDPLSLNINTSLIEKAITKKTRAIMPVHLFGQSADMGPLMRLAKKYQLQIIEDAACVLGATYAKQKCGTIGDVGCFSFHPRKIITTGEGGVIVTKSKKIAQKLRLLRNHGLVSKQKKIDFVLPGFNYRLTELAAALGLIQMDKLSTSLISRQKLAGIYHTQLSTIDWIQLPVVMPYNTHVYQTYVIQVRKGINRNKLIAYLRQEGIEANIGTYALHGLTFYKNKYHLKASSYPVAEKAYTSTVSLPFFDHLTIGDIAMIADKIRRFK